MLKMDRRQSPDLEIICHAATVSETIGIDARCTGLLMLHSYGCTPSVASAWAYCGTKSVVQVVQVRTISYKPLKLLVPAAQYCQCASPGG